MEFECSSRRLLQTVSEGSRIQTEVLLNSKCRDIQNCDFSNEEEMRSPFSIQSICEKT